MTPELELLKNEKLTAMAKYLHPIFNQSDWCNDLCGALDSFSTAYLDEAIRKCVPEHEYCTCCKEDGFRCSCIGANERFVKELLSNIERFKKGEL